VNFYSVTIKVAIDLNKRISDRGNLSPGHQLHLGRHGADMKVGLRKRDLDAGFAEGLVDEVVELVFDDD